MGDACLEPQHRRCQRAPRALGQALCAFTVAGDGLALRLRVGKL